MRIKLKFQHLKKNCYLNVRYAHVMHRYIILNVNMLYKVIENSNVYQNI